MSIFVAERARRDEAAVEANRKALQITRDTELESITHTFFDGSIVQVRPRDLPNFQMAISLGGDHRWIMADNTVRLTTNAELQAAVGDGVTQAKAIWEAYVDALSG